MKVRAAALACLAVVVVVATPGVRVAAAGTETTTENIGEAYISIGYPSS